MDCGKTSHFAASPVHRMIAFVVTLSIGNSSCTADFGVNFHNAEYLDD